MKTLIKLYKCGVCTQIWVDHLGTFNTDNNNYCFFMVYSDRDELDSDTAFLGLSHYDSAELNEQHYDLKTVTDWKLLYNDLDVTTKMKQLQ